MLHRKVKLSKDEYDTIIDTDYDFVTGKKNLISARDWIEWQANQFASAILMPRKTFRTSVENIQSNMGIKRNLGSIILEDASYSYTDFKKIVSHLMKVYKVNKTNVEYRMNDLGILIDNRGKNVKHISELLREE